MLTEENSPGDLNIYSEVEGKDGSVYDIGKKPFKLPSLQMHQISKSDLPKIGISLVSMSSDARFVATKNELQPNVVWVWELIRL